MFLEMLVGTREAMSERARVCEKGREGGGRVSISWWLGHQAAVDSWEPESIGRTLSRFHFTIFSFVMKKAVFMKNKFYEISVSDYLQVTFFMSTDY